MSNIKTSNPNLQAEELERLEMLQKSRENKGLKLGVDIISGELQQFDEIKSLVAKDFENPQEKYDIYYKGIGRILRKYLPSGKENKAGRELIYDEKNIFLNLGKKKSDNKGIRGSDGRMTYQPVMKEMLEVILQWVTESQDPIKLYDMLWELNEKHNYGHEVYDETSKASNRKKKSESDK
ncbi:MAG: hypothetical protein JSS76_10980 [Bacteroidetes bacterium]|nr:hypothetical protein [Bacteroidota bacterium]